MDGGRLLKGIHTLRIAQDTGTGHRVGERRERVMIPGSLQSEGQTSQPSGRCHLGAALAGTGHGWGSCDGRPCASEWETKYDGPVGPEMLDNMGKS